MAISSATAIIASKIKKPRGSSLKRPRFWNIILSSFHKRQKRQEFSSCGLFRAKNSSGSGSYDIAARLLDSPHGHAKMLSFNNNSNSIRVYGFCYGICDLSSKTLLQLGPSSQNFYYPAQFACSNNFAFNIRNISYMSYTIKGKEMMFTK